MLNRNREPELREFDSLQTWVDYSEAQATGTLSCASDRPRRDFCGVNTRKEAFALFRNGHPKGRERMKKVLDALTSQITLESPQYVFCNSIEGCAPNVEAFIQGLPEDMFDFEQVTMDAPPSVLTVQLELRYNCGVSIESMTLAGAVLFAATEALKMQGCCVNVLGSYTVLANRVWQITIPIPNTTDLDTLSFVYTHPAMLRTMIFATEEKETDAIRKEFGFHNAAGYGMPSEWKNPEADVMLSMQRLTMILHAERNSMACATRIFNNLVASKFTTY